MTRLVETIPGGSLQQSEGPADAADTIPSGPILPSGTEFLDESWGEEFDRRLAAWESESPVTAPANEPVKPVGS